MRVRKRKNSHIWLSRQRDAAEQIAPVPLHHGRHGPRLVPPAEALVPPAEARAAATRRGNAPVRRSKTIAFLTALIATTAITGVTATAALGEVVTTLFGESTQTVDIVILLTILTVLPSIVLMMTGFTRILIVLSFMRNALGMQQTPPNQVLVGLALFLTFFVMSPVLTSVYNDAYIPFTNQEITQDEFIDRVMAPTHDFMLAQTTDSDLEFMVSLSKEEIDDPESVPNSVLIPAFILSEIKQAFILGFFIYIPFIVIDMVVASTLMAMGMMMLPPAMISLPFKVLMFVLVDGWQLVIGALVKSYG
ncbi:MAG: flagellar type III secretion system pore protein FliP [Oscillospiraceae bacterium]|nr:flagellar type III secretion system pore protein FliP [Oscillospiraceae bacterium]